MFRLKKGGVQVSLALLMLMLLVMLVVSSVVLTAFLSSGRVALSTTEEIPRIDQGKYQVADQVRFPQKLLGDGSLAPLDLEDRLRMLELKVNADLNWGVNPWVASTETVQCKEKNIMSDQMAVCHDNIKKNNCVVYDFGLREQIEWSLYYAEEWGCEVHGFDPSPISVKWFAEKKHPDSKKADELPNYHYHPIGAGGIDGKRACSPRAFLLRLL